LGAFVLTLAGGAKGHGLAAVLALRGGVVGFDALRDAGASKLFYVAALRDEVLLHGKKMLVQQKTNRLLGICFRRDAPETAVGPARRAGIQKV
jgi:hypothetical protein